GAGALPQPAGSGRLERRARRDAGPRLVVLALEARHHLGGARHLVDDADALAAAPDVLPGLGLAALAATELHGAHVALGQVVGVEARRHDAGLQVVAVHAGEQARIDDVVGVAGDDRLLVVVARPGFV